MPQRDLKDEILTTFCTPGKCKSNCRRKVNCFAHLGERFWFNEIKDSFWSSLRNPELERKAQENHVGLKNLGATCYVNTFLQLWFHNKAFRKAIYGWKLPDGYEVKVNDNGGDISKSLTLDFGGDQAHAICGNLQYLFTLLEYSCKRYVDPSSFVKCLGLQTDQQQDAQEFSKLFLSVLTDAFSLQNNYLSNVIESQFCGMYKYQTKCTICLETSATPSKFFELDLNTKGHTILAKCLGDFLREEVLQGENQYFCSTCQRKQDATRRIVLERLPPILKLHLIRFMFDRKTGTKKKINSMLSFPETLDMNKYMEFKDVKDGYYQLSSVLIHRGRSAYSGHYIAHIYDKQNGVWCRYNDEDVAVMKGKTLNLGKEDDLDEISETPPKRARLSEPTKAVHNSKNAYMLVYTRVAHDNINLVGSVVNAPQTMRELVAKDNSLFDAWVTEINDLQNTAVRNGKERQTKIQTIFSKLRDTTAGDNHEWISTKWLSDWLNPENTGIHPIDNTELLCTHKMVDPLKTHLMKRITAEAASYLFAEHGGGPQLTTLCPKCLVFQQNKLNFGEKLQSDMKLFNVVMKASYCCNSAKGFWLGKKSLKKIRQLAQQEFDDAHGDKLSKAGDKNTIENKQTLFKFNQDAACLEHTNLCLTESSRKLVSEEVWIKCKEYFPSALQFSSNVEVCTLCQNEECTSKLEDEKLRIHANEQKKRLGFLLENSTKRMEGFLNQNAVTLHVILASFVDTWKKQLRNVRRSPLTSIDNSDIFCEHKKLLYQAEEIIDEACQREPDLYLISTAELEMLMEYYTVPQKAVVNVTNEKKTLYTLTPEYCQECRNARLLAEAIDSQSFVGAPIYILKHVIRKHGDMELGNDESIPLRQECKVMISPLQKNKDIKLFNFEASQNEYKTRESRRRSSRQRTKCGEYMVRVDSDQTLRQLKIQLTQIFSVLPIEQKLMFESGKCIEGDDKCLSELEIYSGAHLLLLVEEVTQESSSREEITEVKSMGPEEGFKDPIKRPIRNMFIQMALLSNNGLRVMFFGTDNFSLAVLASLNKIRLQGDNRICAIDVVSCAKPTRIKKRLVHPPVIEYSHKENLAHVSWLKMRQSKRLPSAYDLAVVASFGALIPANLISKFKRGAINIHPSLLPRYRGAAPIVHTILNDDVITGVSVVEVSAKKFDSGRILHQTEIMIPEGCTSDELTATLARESAQLMPFVIDNLDRLLACSTPQNELLVTHAPKVTSEDGYIDFDRHSCKRVQAMQRALPQKIGVQALYQGKRVRLGNIVTIRPGFDHGTSNGFCYYDKKEKLLHVKMADGYIGVRSLQVECRQEIPAVGFHNGYMVDKTTGKLAGDVTFKCLTEATSVERRS